MTNEVTISPLAKKLQVKSGKHWLLFNAPANYLTLLEPLPEGATVSYEAKGSFDGVQLFVKNNKELEENLKVVIPALKSDTVFWVIYPKKNSGIETDLTMMGSWSAPANHGLEPVASAAVDETWTALRFRPIGQAKASHVGADEIRQNEYGKWIDVDKKTITLREDIKQALEQNSQALANYEKLSWSNRKEYVLWILTAKQERTREERLVKMVEKLVAGKKNPAEK
ncbi:MAG: YdeI/OmpD-associated family protein [Bacteroidetes bacterium]|nr:YdeI/OmpD-associated family protein [Bacteroidota bacterium]